MCQVVIPRTRRGLVVRLTLLAFVVALVAALEISVRQITPDELQYSVVQTTFGHTDFSFSRTITDPATVARWRAAMTATPSGQYIWQTGGACAGGVTFYNISYTFLWHGLPVETVDLLPSCAQRFEVSSGGIPDLHSYNVSESFQPCAVDPRPCE